MSINSVAYLMTGLFEAIMIFTLFDTFFNRKYEHSNWMYIVNIFILAVLINLSNNFSQNGIMNAVGMSVSFFVMSFLFKGNIPVKAVISVLSFLLIVILEIIVLFTISLVFDLSVYEAVSIPSYVLLGIIVSKMVTFMVINAIKVKFKRNSFMFGTSYWMLFILIFATSIIAIFLIFRLSYDIQETYMYNLSIVCSLGLLFSTFFALYLYENLATQSETIRKQQNYQQHLKSQIKHLDDILVSQMQLKRFKHDFKNHEIALRAYLETGDCSGAKAYLDNLGQAMIIGENLVDTGNLALDAIVNTKKAIAESKGIDFCTKIQLPEKINIAPEDICIIFGNALDNAIEACEKVKETSRRIVLDALYSDCKMFLKISNSAQNVDNSLNTSKKDKANHGFGLENIKAVLNKYGSYPEITISDDEFVLKFVVFFE